jgi:hypothetical protein
MGQLREEIALGMLRTFMTNSGLKLPSPAIPIPALEVPNAAPTAINVKKTWKFAPQLCQS